MHFTIVQSCYLEIRELRAGSAYAELANVEVLYGDDGIAFPLGAILGGVVAGHLLRQKDIETELRGTWSEPKALDRV